MGEWRTIESAPKDGTWIIVAWLDAPGGAALSVRWMPALNDWIDADGDVGFRHPSSYQPTHWTRGPVSAREPGPSCVDDAFSSATVQCLAVLRNFGLIGGKLYEEVLRECGRKEVIEFAERNNLLEFAGLDRYLEMIAPEVEG
jgi:hypothetical protein